MIQERSDFMQNLNNLFINIYPSLDLHGEFSDTIAYLINDFINDNVKLGNKIIVIIHGKGEGILKEKTEEILKNHKLVNSYALSVDNPGATIVELKVSSK